MLLLANRKVSYFAVVTSKMAVSYASIMDISLRWLLEFVEKQQKLEEERRREEEEKEEKRRPLEEEKEEKRRQLEKEKEERRRLLENKKNRNVDYLKKIYFLFILFYLPH